ncbi:4764_t:CDS:1, partial [Racocetra persica]
PLADFWRVDTHEIPKLLHDEQILKEADKIIKSLLVSYKSKFGGSTISAKFNKITVYYVDSLIIKILKNSKKMQPYLGLLIFKHEPNSLVDLESKQDNIFNVTHYYSSVDIVFYIDIQLINNVVVNLGDRPDWYYEDFVNAIKKFDPIIWYPPKQHNSPRAINNNETDHNIRRDIRPLLLNGEEILVVKNNFSCSVGFFGQVDGSDVLVTAGH